jgi:hypothetical protein
MWDNFFKLHLWLATYLCLYLPPSWLCDVRGLGGGCVSIQMDVRIGWDPSLIPFWFSMTYKLELLSDTKCWKSCHVVGRGWISQAWTKKGIQEHLLHVVPMEFVLWRKRGGGVLQPTLPNVLGSESTLKGGGGGLDVHQISNQSVGIYISKLTKNSKYSIYFLTPMNSNFYTPFLFLYGIIGMWPLTISSMIESPLFFFFFQSHKIHTNANP